MEIGTDRWQWDWDSGATTTFEIHPQPSELESAALAMIRVFDSPEWSSLEPPTELARLVEAVRAVQGRCTACGKES